MKVFKAHAQGNDYLIAPVKREAFLAEDLAPLSRAICHRHLGIGSDGIVFLHKSMEPEPNLFHVRIFNPDGGEAEVSGNGIRCTAACLSHLYPESDGKWLLQTKSGLKMLQLLDRKESCFVFQADMGTPVFQANPSLSGSPIDLAEMQEYALPIEGRVFRIHPLSIGNPHCVLFLSEALPTDWLLWSDRISHDEFFPHQTNVEWVQVESVEKITVHFWERGVGMTTASGSGSCAAAVAAIAAGRTKERVIVQNRMGTMIVEWRPPRGNVLLTGEAEIVMEGDYLFRA